MGGHAQGVAYSNAYTFIPDIKTEHSHPVSMTKKRGKIKPLRVSMPQFTPISPVSDRESHARFHFSELIKSSTESAGRVISWTVPLEPSSTDIFITASLLGASIRVTKS